MGKELELEEGHPVNDVCQFCLVNGQKEEELGKLYKFKNIISHHYCLVRFSEVSSYSIFFFSFIF